ncbi:ATP-dependent zinc metalloprotease FtsH [Gossypium australe]|uniref:ATP-dependent zinc metalloprotease FtsH n=1 Tax=Gossypium australe TaxID=47621 RepID=A0A5B6UVK1_9ROSI|nr:ATP-dependent zinc metalloprotease FtsH [Gossypium australe]
MSSRGRGRNTRGRGRGRMSVSEPVGSRHGSESDAPPPAVEVEQQDQTGGDDAVSQAVLRMLERVAGANMGNRNRKSVPERLRANGAEVFRGVSGVAPNVAEYWLEAVERIMDDLDLTAEEKLKGVVSLLRDEAYQWWLTVKESTPADRVDWGYFKIKFEGKYVGASYVDAQRKAFLNLVQGNKSIAEYEAEFLRLSRYARGIVATDYERCVRFEDGLRDELRVLIAPQRERDFAVLVEKARIAEEVKKAERLNRERNRDKRSVGSPEVVERVQKRPRVETPVHIAKPVAGSPDHPCAQCGRYHIGGCWNRVRECFRCKSKTHLIKDCPQNPNRTQTVSQGYVQPGREGQQATRGRGSNRGGNGSGQGRGVVDRGNGATEARQPGLVFAVRRRGDNDVPDGSTGKFLKSGMLFVVLFVLGGAWQRGDLRELFGSLCRKKGAGGAAGWALLRPCVYDAICKGKGLMFDSREQQMGIVFLVGGWTVLEA